MRVAILSHCSVRRSLRTRRRSIFPTQRVTQTLTTSTRTGVRARKKLDFFPLHFSLPRTSFRPLPFSSISSALFHPLHPTLTEIPTHLDQSISAQSLCHPIILAHASHGHPLEPPNPPKSHPAGISDMVEKKRRSVCVTLGLNPESETLQRFRHRSEEKRRSVCVTFGQDPVSCCV